MTDSRAVATRPIWGLGAELQAGMGSCSTVSASANRSSTVESSSGTAGEATGSITFGCLRVPLTIR